MSIGLRVGGVPATEIAPHSPPTWETWADGGCGTASWAFALSPRAQHQALRLGARVEITCGGYPLWVGRLSEPDRTTGECTAYGFSSEARTDYLAITTGNIPTRDVGDAIYWAIQRGWSATNPGLLGGVAAGDTSNGPIKLGQLLDEFAEQTTRRWGVDALGRVYMAADPTTPQWLASPDAAAFGTTDEGRVGVLLGRYLEAGTGVYQTAVAGTGTPEESVDLTQRGELGVMEAHAILGGALARDSGPKWTNGVTLSSSQIQTFGGTPAFLPAVRAGQMMRSLGLSYSHLAGALDTVIGKTRYTAGEDTIFVEPVNTAPRTYVDVIAAA